MSQQHNDANFGDNGARLSEASGSPRAAAVLCVTCGKGIGNPAELALMDSGPTHVRCRPALQTKPQP